MGNKILDIEDMKEYGVLNNFCPYYYSVQIENNYDIMFLPYNYLLQKKIIKSLHINLGNS